MVTKGGPGGVNRTLWSDLVRYINDETSPVNRNTLALVPPAADLEALAQPSLPDQEARQLVHDMWCHPGNDMEQIFKALRGRGFPRGFITKLRKFHCATCAVSKLTRSYRRSKRVKVAAAKRVKVAAAKRAPQAHTLRERTSEQEAQKQDSGTTIKQLSCQGCQRIFGSVQGLASHLTDSYQCPSSSNYHPPTVEPAKRVLQRAEASTALHQISALASVVTNEPQTD